MQNYHKLSAGYKSSFTGSGDSEVTLKDGDFWLTIPTSCIQLGHFKVLYYLKFKSNFHIGTEVMQFLLLPVAVCTRLTMMQDVISKCSVIIYMLNVLDLEPYDKN